MLLPVPSLLVVPLPSAPGMRPVKRVEAAGTKSEATATKFVVKSVKRSAILRRIAITFISAFFIWYNTPFTMRPNEAT